jgi:hypothetical protein
MPGRCSNSRAGYGPMDNLLAVRALKRILRPSLHNLPPGHTSGNGTLCKGFEAQGCIFLPRTSL